MAIYPTDSGKCCWCGERGDISHSVEVGHKKTQWVGFCEDCVFLVLRTAYIRRSTR